MRQVDLLHFAGQVMHRESQQMATQEDAIV